MARFIRPPRPASYLQGVPRLDPALREALVGRPTAEQLQEATRVLERLRQLIREAREWYEHEHDVVIEPEPGGFPTLQQILDDYRAE